MFENDWKMKTDYPQLVKSVNLSRLSSDFYQDLNVTNVQIFRQILTNRLWGPGDPGDTRGTAGPEGPGSPGVPELGSTFLPCPRS